MAAVSRTDRVMTPSVTQSLHDAPRSGPSVARPRDGLRPTTPHAPAGLRIEPPPSPACATATMRAATAAADPPLDPPTMRVGSHGLRVGPNVSGSVVGDRPSSGVLVLPANTKPARRNRDVSSLSVGDTQFRSRNTRVPPNCVVPASVAPRSFNSSGTPRNGPSPRSPRASCARASS
jgi:hypothetical protein